MGLGAAATNLNPIAVRQRAADRSRTRDDSPRAPPGDGSRQIQNDATGATGRFIIDESRGRARSKRTYADEKGALMDYRLELIVIPVTDMDRAKAFYCERAGFDVDVDHRAGEDFRVIQLTPRGSACS